MLQCQILIPNTNLIRPGAFKQSPRRAGAGGGQNRERPWLAPEVHAPAFDGFHGPGSAAPARSVLNFLARDRGDSLL